MTICKAVAKAHNEWASWRRFLREQARNPHWHLYQKASVYTNSSVENLAEQTRGPVGPVQSRSQSGQSRPVWISQTDMQQQQQQSQPWECVPSGSTLCCVASCCAALRCVVFERTLRGARICEREGQKRVDLRSRKPCWPSLFDDLAIGQLGACAVAKSEGRRETEKERAPDGKGPGCLTAASRLVAKCTRLGPNTLDSLASWSLQSHYLGTVPTVQCLALPYRPFASSGKL